MAGQTRDAGWPRVVEVVDLGATQVVVLIGAAKGHLALNAAQGDIAHLAIVRVGMTAGETHEDGVAGIDGMDVLDQDAVDKAAVARLDGNGRTEGVPDVDTPDGDIAETAIRGSAELDGAGAGGYAAVLDADILAAEVGIVALEADAIVGRIDIATADDGVLAVVDVDAVVVPITAVDDGDAVDENMLATVDGESPACRIAEGDTVDVDVLAMVEEEKLGARRGALATLIVIGVQALAGMVEAIDGECQIEALSIDGAQTTDADVLGTIADDQAQMDILVTTLAHALVDGIVVVGIGATQQGGLRMEVEFHMALEADHTGEPSARTDIHTAAFGLCRDAVDGLLDGPGAERLTIANGTTRRDIERITGEAIGSDRRLGAHGLGTGSAAESNEEEEPGMLHKGDKVLLMIR